MIRAYLIALSPRLMANATDVVANISSARAVAFFNESFGGNTLNKTDAPNWGMALWDVVSVYPDYVGQIAWFVLFAIPFLMMWITHADMLPAAVIGMFLGIYILGFVGVQYMGMGIALIVLAVATVIWSVFIRRL